MGSSKMLLLLVAATAVAGATMANVSPGDQGNPKTALRSALPDSSATSRSKPGPMAPVSRRRRVPASQRVARQSAGAGAGSFASSGAGSFSGSSGMGNYQGSYMGNNPAGFGFPGAGNQFPSYPFHNPNPVGVMPFDFNSLFQYLQQMQQQFQQNALNQGYSNNAIGGGSMDNVASYMGSGMGYSDGASAVASIGPGGGYGSANLYPDLGNRFGSESGNVPPPNGGNVGVFTSSSSGSSDINGHRTSYKTATSGINDNGKITTYTVRDPPK